MESSKYYIINENIQSKYVVCVASLHIVVAHVAARAQLIVDHVLYHHVLAIKLLDDDIAVLRIGMHATDIVVRDSYRIVAVFGVNNEIPRASLALVACSSLALITCSLYLF